jgi:predicted nucleic acid-binding protein
MNRSTQPMNDAGVIDTNILIRSIVLDIPDQADQVKVLLGRIAAGEVTGTVLPTVFLEVVFTLERQYGFPRAQVVEALLAILEMVGMRVVDRAQLMDATDIYRTRRSVSFADAYHSAMARDFHGGGIVSFDRKLDGVDGVTRREPASV